MGREGLSEAGSGWIWNREKGRDHERGRQIDAESGGETFILGCMG